MKVAIVCSFDGGKNRPSTLYSGKWVGGKYFKVWVSKEDAEQYIRTNFHPADQPTYRVVEVDMDVEV